MPAHGQCANLLFNFSYPVPTSSPLDDRQKRQVEFPPLPLLMSVVPTTITCLPDDPLFLILGFCDFTNLQRLQSINRRFLRLARISLNRRGYYKICYPLSATAIDTIHCTKVRLNRERPFTDWNREFQDFPNCENVTHLISEFSITKFNYLPSLRSLKLTSIIWMDDHLPNIPTLTHLATVGHSGISPSAEFPNLRSFSHFALDAVPRFVPALSQLTVLNLKGNIWNWNRDVTSGVSNEHALTLSSVDLPFLRQCSLIPFQTTSVAFHGYSEFTKLTLGRHVEPMSLPACIDITINQSNVYSRLAASSSTRYIQLRHNGRNCEVPSCYLPRSYVCIAYGMGLPTFYDPVQHLVLANIDLVIGELTQIRAKSLVLWQCEITEMDVNDEFSKVIDLRGIEESVTFRPFRKDIPGTHYTFLLSPHCRLMRV